MPDPGVPVLSCLWQETLPVVAISFLQPALSFLLVDTHIFTSCQMRVLSLLETTGHSGPRIRGSRFRGLTSFGET